MPCRRAGPWPVEASIRETSSVPRSCAVVYLQHGKVGWSTIVAAATGAAARAGRARALARLEQVVAARERARRPECLDERVDRGRAARAREQLIGSEVGRVQYERALERPRRRAQGVGIVAREHAEQDPELERACGREVRTGVVGRGATGREVAYPGGRRHAGLRRQARHAVLHGAVDGVRRRHRRGRCRQAEDVIDLRRSRAPASRRAPRRSA